MRSRVQAVEVHLKARFTTLLNLCNRKHVYHFVFSSLQKQASGGGGGGEMNAYHSAAATTTGFLERDDFSFCTDGRLVSCAAHFHSAAAHLNTVTLNSIPSSLLLVKSWKFNFGCRSRRDLIFDRANRADFLLLSAL